MPMRVNFAYVKFTRMVHLKTPVDFCPLDIYYIYSITFLVDYETQGTDSALESGDAGIVGLVGPGADDGSGVIGADA